MLDKTKTANDIIAEYFQIKDYLATETKRFADFCAPWKARMDEIENHCLERLNELGGDARQSIKTEAGTAYRSTIVTPKIVDRDKYLDAVLENWDTFGSGMLQIGAPKKESVDDYMQTTNGQLPPGVEISSYTRCNLRRS
jgi:hypothetical protein